MQANYIRPSWTGFHNVRHLIIFGDSYSAIGYRPASSPRPSPQSPLGIRFPGNTWAEPGAPNWVGHLVTKYNPHGPILAYDYAYSGDGVSAMVEQIQAKFLPLVGRKPEWAPWSASDSLFVTWIGINDCSGAHENKIKAAMKQLFEQQERLYNAGARNFLFIDVPPMHRSPAVQSRVLVPEDAAPPYRMWNQVLKEAIAQFAEAHEDVTTMLFSSWRTFSRILDNPVAHGLDTGNVAGGSIWVDDFHPTTAVHDWIARDLAEFLTNQAAFSS